MVHVSGMSLAARIRTQVSRLRAAGDGSAGRLRLVYFLYFAASGVSLPYLSAYLRGRGFTGDQIGTIQVIPSLLGVLLPPAWALVADLRRDPVPVLRWITAWAACSALFLPFAATPLTVGAVVLAQSLGGGSVVALLDTVSLDHCRKHPGTSYSRIRMFGSLGFVALAFALGWVLTARGGRPGDVVVPATIAGVAVCYALAARRLAPAPSAHPERPSWRDLVVLLGNRRLMLLLAACAVHWAACVPYVFWIGVFVQDLHLAPDVAGSGITAGVLAEIGAMLAFPWLDRRFSARALLALAFLGSAVRWALLARATHPAAVVALQLLHGLTYGLFWPTLMMVLAQMIPGRLRATGLALSSAVVFGLGNAVGSKLAGRLYDHYHSVGPLFGWSAAADLAITVGVVILLAGGAARRDVSGVDGGA